MKLKCVIRDLFVQLVTILLLNTTCNHLLKIRDLSSRKSTKTRRKKGCKICTLGMCLYITQNLE